MPRHDSCCDSLAADPERTVSAPGSPKYMRDICDRPASMKRDDANTTETQNKKSGTITSFFRRIVSRDKKMMTVTKRQNDAQGDTVLDIEVFDRI